VVLAREGAGGSFSVPFSSEKGEIRAFLMVISGNAATGCRRPGKMKGWRALFLALTIAIPFIEEVGGWIALSKDGYKITQRLLLNNGSRIEGDILINGVIQSSEYTWLGPKVENPYTCDITREGAVRWNYDTGDLEGCDRVQYQPLRFCDRDCGFEPAPLQTLRAETEGGESTLSRIFFAYLIHTRLAGV
jgi:hypothetical protein